MGMILCEDRSVTQPLLVDSLGIRIFSLEELCYLIHEYPLIAIDNFVNDDLIKFLKDDLNIGIQAVQLERRRNEGISDDDILISILAYSDYYTVPEIDRFKSRLSAIRALPPHKLCREKGDLAFSLGYYGKAISHYENALAEAAADKADKSFSAQVYNCIGNSYANLFEYESAFEAIYKAYELTGDRTCLKKFYFLSALDPIIEHKQKYLSVLPDGTNVEWSKEFEKASQEVRESEEVARIDAIMERDSVRRLRLIEQEISKQKDIYRKML